MRIAIVILFIGCFVARSQEDGFFQKADKFFSEYAKNGRVNYNSLREDHKSFDELIDFMDSYEWEEQEEKAYLINAYNLFVIDQLIDNDPVNSPMEIPGFFDNKIHSLNGKKLALNHLENKMIREVYNDPRVHFVLVCGGLGCPPIADFAYTPDQLEQQLEKQTKMALNNDEFVRPHATKDAILLSEIFKWYQSDFGKNQKEVVEYVNKYREKDFNVDHGVMYYPYDWTVNGTLQEATTPDEDKPDTEVNLQTFTAGSLLRKGQFDFTLFNTLYTQDKSNWLGVNSLGYGQTFITHLFQLTYGITKSKQLNVGLDLNFRYSGGSNQGIMPSIRNAYTFKNTDTSRVGLSSVGLRLKLQPFKKVSNFSIQSTFYIPTIPNPEGVSGSANPSDNRFWADWDRWIWWNQFFYDKTFGKFQLFAEIDLLFRFRRYSNQIGMLDMPMNLFLSYFPTNKITIYAMTQHVPRFTNNITPQDPQVTDWVIPMNYTASGLGFKYQIMSRLNLEILYTNFWRGTNTGLGHTYNIGIKYLTK